MFGARPLKRAIQSAIEDPLAKEILESHFGPKDVIHVSMSAGKLSFKKG